MGSRFKVHLWHSMQFLQYQLLFGTYDRGGLRQNMWDAWSHISQIIMLPSSSALLQTLHVLHSGHSHFSCIFFIKLAEIGSSRHSEWYLYWHLEQVREFTLPSLTFFSQSKHYSGLIAEAAAASFLTDFYLAGLSFAPSFSMSLATLFFSPFC